MSRCKKIIISVFIVFLAVCVLISVVSSFVNKVNTTKNLYNDVSYTFKSMYKKLGNSLSELKSSDGSSYTLDIRTDNTSAMPFSAITICNNSKDRYFEVNFKNLKLNDSTVDLSAFTKKDKVGLYFGNNPDLYYIASGKDFGSQWNNSAYSKFIKMPDYIPQNINYNKINSMVSVENLCKLFVGMGLGKEKINLKDLISNFNISQLKDFKATRNGRQTDAQIAYITVSKSYFEDVIQKLLNSSQNAKFDYINDALVCTNEFLKSCNQDTFKIDFVISQNTLLWAETSVSFSKYLVNARLDIYDGEINFSLTNLLNDTQRGIDYFFKLSTNSSLVNMNLKNNQKQIFDISLNKNPDSTVVSKIDYTDKNTKTHSISVTYSPVSKDYRSNVPTKNIYKLSVADLIKLYKKINGSDANLFGAF